MTLLLFSPGYLKIKNKQLAQVADQLQEQRILHQQILTGYRFQQISLKVMESGIWISSSIYCCVSRQFPDTVSIEKVGVMEMVSNLKIKSEKFSDSQVDEFVDRIQTQIKEIAEKAERIGAGRMETVFAARRTDYTQVALNICES